MAATRKVRTPRDNRTPRVKPPADPGERPGTGALCPDAQADGVPCFELGRDCAQCEEAARKE